ncbi:insulinase family protein [Klebsiella pneumoniae]|nr:insulinase family protein [Klebsiella pneumoniae]
MAHLLEHLLFYGGERYQDDDRLMGWVQRQGGSVNATTLLAIARSFSRLPPMLWLMASRVYRRCCRPRCCSGKIFSAKWR